MCGPVPHVLCSVVPLDEQYPLSLSPWLLGATGMGPPGHTELGCHHLPPREHLLFSQKGSEPHFVAGDTEAQGQAVTPPAPPQVPS